MLRVEFERDLSKSNVVGEGHDGLKVYTEEGEYLGHLPVGECKVEVSWNGPPVLVVRFLGENVEWSGFRVKSRAE